RLRVPDRGALPLVARREVEPGPPRVGPRLVPVDVRHRIVVRGGAPGSLRMVEGRARGADADLLAVANPVDPARARGGRGGGDVARRVDEALELTDRDLELPDEVGAERDVADRRDRRRLVDRPAGPQSLEHRL